MRAVVLPVLAVVPLAAIAWLVLGGVADRRQDQADESRPEGVDASRALDVHGKLRKSGSVGPYLQGERGLVGDSNASGQDEGESASAEERAPDGHRGHEAQEREDLPSAGSAEIDAIMALQPVFSGLVRSWREGRIEEYCEKMDRLMPDDAKSLLPSLMRVCQQAFVEFDYDAAAGGLTAIMPRVEKNDLLLRTQAGRIVVRRLRNLYHFASANRHSQVVQKERAQALECYRNSPAGGFLPGADIIVTYLFAMGIRVDDDGTMTVREKQERD